jgi:hypothetical protein
VLFDSGFGSVVNEHCKLQGNLKKGLKRTEFEMLKGQRQ